MNRHTAILLAFLGSAMHPAPSTIGAVRIGSAPSLASATALDAKSGGVGHALAMHAEASSAADETKKPPEQQRIVVVVSNKNPIRTLTAAELGRIFLRQQTQWPNGWAITVFVRPVKTPIRQRFSQDVLHKKPEALREYWLNLKLTRGLKPPKVLRSAKLVKRYLERVKGGIAYLYEDEVDETVRVVEITEKSP